MKLCFDTVEELRAFVKDHLKAKRGGKDEGDADPTLNPPNQAPPPAMPPASGPSIGNFQPQAQPQFQPPQQQPSFPGAVQSNPLVDRIVAKIDSAIAGGQPADAVLQWFRGQCGAEAANATLDQIKGVFLPKLAQPALENIAKLMNA